MRVKAGDVVLVDESLEKDYYTRKYKAVVLWTSPFQEQPLLTNINEWRPHWGCYRHIAKIIGHIDLQQAVALPQKQDNCENCAIAIEDRQPVVRCKACKYWRQLYGDKSSTGCCDCDDM